MLSFVESGSLENSQKFRFGFLIKLNIWKCFALFITARNAKPVWKQMLFFKTLSQAKWYEFTVADLLRRLCANTRWNHINKRHVFPLGHWREREAKLTHGIVHFQTSSQADGCGNCVFNEKRDWLQWREQHQTLIFDVCVSEKMLCTWKLSESLFEKKKCVAFLSILNRPKRLKQRCRFLEFVI